MKRDIRSLTGVVRDCRRPSVSSRDVSLGHWHADAAEIVAINQIGIRIFAKSKHQLRRSSSRHIDHRSANTTEIRVAPIKREPISRPPKIAKERSSLQTDNRFAAHPVAACIKRVARHYEHVSAIACDTAVSPNPAAYRCRRPCSNG